MRQKTLLRGLALVAATTPVAVMGAPAPTTANSATANSATAAMGAAPAALKPVVEMVFVLDTTGSMSGMISNAQGHIWGIVNGLVKSSPTTTVRVGLVAYRDHGDQYITKILPVTDNLDKVYSTLMDYVADGGGDEPEDVRASLSAGVHQAGWSPRSHKIAQVLFLVGDAPPHDDYVTEPDTCKSAQEARAMGITVNAIQCGNAEDCRIAWERIRKCGKGEYFAIPEEGGRAAVQTPFDAALADLAQTMGTTFVAYGGGPGAAGEAHRQNMAKTQADLERKFYTTAAKPAQAERAINKALNTLAYSGDLIQSLENRKIRLKDVRKADLPLSLARLPQAELDAAITQKLAERTSIRATILALSKDRDTYLASYGIRRPQTEVGFNEAIIAALKKETASRRSRPS